MLGPARMSLCWRTHGPIVLVAPCAPAGRVWVSWRRAFVAEAPLWSRASIGPAKGMVSTELSMPNCGQGEGSMQGEDDDEATFAAQASNIG